MCTTSPNGTRTSVVHVTVSGGLVQAVDVPEGVTVIVRDYDTEGLDDDVLQDDGSGQLCVQTIWTNRHHGELADGGLQD